MRNILILLLLPVWLFSQDIIVQEHPVDSTIIFDGITDYIIIPSYTWIPGQTVSFWMNSSDLSVASYRSVFGRNLSYAYLRIANLGATRGFELETNINGILLYLLAPSQILYEDTWHNIAVVWQESDLKFYLYVDGIYAAVSGVANDDELTFTNIGRGYSSTNHWWEGMLKEFLIIDAELTQSDITALYNNGTPTNAMNAVWYPSSTSGYWPLGNATDYPTTYDISGNSNNGVMTSMVQADIVVSGFTNEADIITTPSIVDTDEYTAVYNAMTDKPDWWVADQQKLFVSTLVNAGIWGKLDALYVLAAHTDDNGEARINWISPGTNDASPQTVINFIPFEGFTGNLSSGGQMNTNYNPTTDATNYTQNSASFGYYCRTDQVYTVTRCDFGVLDTYRAYTLFNTGGTLLTYCNSIGTTASVATSDGMIITNRPDANNLYLYKNGSQISTNADVATGIPNKDFFILSRNASSYSDRQVAMGFTGGALSVSDIGILTDVFENYMDSNDKGVIDDASNYSHYDYDISTMEPTSLLANPYFLDWTDDDPDDWTAYDVAGGIFTKNGNACRIISDGTYCEMYSSNTLTVGKKYKWKVTVTEVISGSIRLVEASILQVFSTVGTYEGEYTATLNRVRFSRNTACDVTFTNVIIWEE